MSPKDRRLIQKVPNGGGVLAYHCSHCRWGITVSESDTSTEVDKVFDGHNCGEHIVTPVRL